MHLRCKNNKKLLNNVLFIEKSLFLVNDSHLSVYAIMKPNGIAQ